MDALDLELCFEGRPGEGHLERQQLVDQMVEPCLAQYVYIGA